MPLRLHAGLRLNTAAWEGAKLTPSTSQMAAILDEAGPAVLGRSVAIHEAGHAVVALASGHQVTAIVLTDNGLSHGSTSWQCDIAYDPVAYLAVCFAGVEAETRWLREIGASKLMLDHAERQAASDQAQANTTIRDHHISAREIVRAYRDADTLLRRHWRGVEEVAYQLDLANSLADEQAIRRMAGL